MQFVGFCSFTGVHAAHVVSDELIDRGVYRNRQKVNEFGASRAKSGCVMGQLNENQHANNFQPERITKINFQNKTFFIHLTNF